MRADKSVLEILEFSRALGPFRERLSGELGERVLRELRPAQSPDQLQRRFALLREWMDLIDAGSAIQFSAALPDVCSLFPGARRSGVLSGQELLMFRAVMESARRIREALAGLSGESGKSRTGEHGNPRTGALGNTRTGAPGNTRTGALEGLRHHLRDFSPEIEMLMAVEDSGRLRDSASPKLFEIRGKIDSLKRSGRRTAQRLFEDANITNMLQERTLNWRDGRFLLLVRQEYINRFPGLTVERSASGNSVYMEPRMLSSVNNGLMMATRDERDEEHRILAELTRAIIEREGAVTEAVNVIGTLDLLNACDDLIRTRGWVMPELVKGREFALFGARHPLLKDAAVPVDVRCGGDFSALVVTGPNTGGKTVVMKTVGVMLMTAWLGLPVACRDGTKVGCFDEIFADIGDEQSIEQNLSTFSAHLKRITEILGKATSASVVLLDELGAGTDPQEGAALGTAILETLRRRGTLTLATTHHNPIKQYALTTKGVETASMEFDAERLEPTYRLLMGVPGRSNAILIARRCGMPEEVLALAQGSIDEREASAEDIMGELNERRAALELAEREFRATVAETERLRKAYSDRVAEIDLQRDSIMEAADRKAVQLIRRAEDTSREMIKGLEETVKMAAIRGLNDKRGEIKKLRGSMEKRQAKRAEREAERRPASFVVEVGATVQVAGSGIVGLVEEVRNGKAKLIAGPMHMEVPVEQLVPTDKKAKVAVPPSNADKLMKQESVPPSIMVRGMMVGEAMPLVETYLDRAYRANHTSVTVIHGRGEGILRREVHALCARLKYVKSYKLGLEGEGGFGVTIVTFR